MIKLVCGNVGSGKTASMVRYMRNNPHKNFITNIDVRGKDFKHVMKLKADMIIKKEFVREKRTGEKVYNLSLNKEFWENLIKEHKSMNIIIDEAHIFLNPRRAFNKINIIVTDFMALLRRVLGSSDSTGELILIVQLIRRIDPIARDMATDVSYCIHRYMRSCRNCSLTWQETNEMSAKPLLCPRCSSYRLERHNSLIEVFDFRNVEDFVEWKNFGTKRYHSHYIINDIETVFNNYNTLQLDDLLSNY